MIEQLITVYIGAAIIGITYIAWLLSGAFNVAYSKTREWSWRRFFEDLLKVILRLGFLGAITIAINLIDWYCARLGADVSKLADIFSVGGVAALTAKASAGYASKAYNNFKNFIDTLHTEPIELEVDPDAVDWQGIAQDIEENFRAFAEAITPKHTTDEEQTETAAEPSEAEVAEIVAEAGVIEVGQGSETLPMNRILPDGDKDNGKGWQCSKYAWYLATGIRMNYAPHPDYGPCNGDKMVEYLIQKLGWVECTKMDGAIFSYKSGQYGHTGLVKNAAQNLVNDANWQPLATGTHYLNLDAVGARYACPKAMLAQNTTTTTKPAQTASKPQNTATSNIAASKPAEQPSSPDKSLIFRKGENVRPLRLVDYDGRNLRRYDEVYYVVQDVEKGQDRVVLGARGQIWAAMKVNDIMKV